tara:strand:+ start:459 stop:740 length:282 start_codon:yes stop_codon:yes gene_type:complete
MSGSGWIEAAVASERLASVLVWLSELGKWHREKKRPERVRFATKLAVLVYGSSLLVLPAEREALSHLEFFLYFAALHAFFGLIALLFQKMKWV